MAKKNEGMIQLSGAGPKDNVPSPGSKPKKVKKTSSKEPKAKKRMAK